MTYELTTLADLASVHAALGFASKQDVDAASAPAIAATVAGFSAKLGTRSTYTGALATHAEVGDYVAMVGSAGGGDYTKFKVARLSIALGQAGSADVFAQNSVVNIDAGFGSNSAIGHEIDLNNNNQHYDTLVYPYHVANLVSGAGTYRATAAFMADGSSELYNYGFVAYGPTVKQADFLAGSTGAVDGIRVTGTKTTGLDMTGATLTNGIRLPNNVGIVTRNAANSADLSIAKINSGDSMEFGYSCASVLLGTTFLPALDNVFQFGDGTHRFTSLWAVNGTIQTSDPSTKTDISALPSVLGLVQNLDPKTFRFKSGGMDPVDVEVEREVQATALVEREVETVEVVRGVARLIKTVETVEEPLWDALPVIDARGEPVMDTIRGRDAVVGPDGEEVSPAVPERLVPRVHRVARMVKTKVVERQWRDRAGRRLHWGFMADEVKSAFDALGLDFGGFVVGEDGMMGLRMDQMVPVLWKAVQELAARKISK